MADPVINDVNVIRGKQGNRASVPDRFVTLSPINETFEGPNYGANPVSGGEVPSDPLGFVSERPSRRKK